MRLLFEGENLSVRQWAIRKKINVKTLRSRIELLGWTVERTLSSPVRDGIPFVKMYPRLYNVWCSMRRRCRNKSNKDYKHYGGRGITIDERWNKFAAFLWDMEPGYKQGLELERIDNSGGYCKENCRWATRKEQVRNRRVTPRLTIAGVTRSLGEWADVAGVPRCRIKDRVRLGWGAAEAVYGAKKKNKYV